MTDVNESVFTVGSVWCCPATTKGVQNTLRYTIDETRRAVSRFKGKEPKEIHHSDGLGSISHELLSVAMEASHSDHSIFRGENSILREPLCWRVVDCSPAFEHHLSHGGEPCGNHIRARAIVSSLRPILNFNGGCKIEIGVVLDSYVWKKAVELCADKINDLVHEDCINISFEFEKSSRIPGLQMADLISGVVRHNYWDQSEKEAFNIVKKHSFDHMMIGTLPKVEKNDRCGETKRKGS